MGFGFSTKEVEGDDKMKTLECLRGRLLAERAVSRAANEEADKLGNKVSIFECVYFVFFFIGLVVMYY